MNPGGLTVTTPSDREIRMTRSFDAPRSLVFEALVRPELVQRWLGVRGGWTLPVCEIDARPGGAYRYVWRRADGLEMGMGGVFQELTPPVRLVATELFDDAWYPGQAVTTTELTEERGRTTLTMTIRYQSEQARDVALRTPMEQGVAESYDRLAGVLQGLA